MFQDVMFYIGGHSSSSREKSAQDRRPAEPPFQGWVDIRPQAEHQAAINESAEDFHPHRGHSPGLEDWYSVAGQEGPSGIRDRTLVTPKQGTTYVETAYTSEHQEVRRSGERSRRNRELQEQIQSLKEENVTFQTLVKTTQGDLVNATNRFDSLERQVKQLTSEKDIWLSEKSQTAAKDGSTEIRELDEIKRRQEGEIQSLKDENATFQTLVETAQGDLMNAVAQSDDLQRQVERLASEKDVWLSEKSQLTGEGRAKEKMIQELDETKRRQESEIQSLKEENAIFRTSMVTTRGDLMNAVNRADDLQRQAKQLTSEKDAWSAEKSQMIAKEREKEKEVWELDETKRGQESEIQRLQEKFQRSEERNNQLEKLLDVRTAELKSAQVFLTTADAYSEADVLKMVEGLNAEISRGASFMAGLLKDDDMMAGSEERVKNCLEFNQRENKPTSQLGSTLLNYLVSAREQLPANPHPLQLAFQAFLTWWCAYMIERFVGGEAGRDIQKVYQHIRDEEAQSIAGRWRAITFGHSKLLTNETHAEYVVETLLSLLGLCGWARSGEKSQKALLSIQAIVGNIAKLWGQLRNATKENVTTMDMQVFKYDPRVVYDAELMEDAYGEIGSLNPQPRRKINPKLKDKILCTIGLGLKKSLIKHSGDGKPYEHIDVSLKPKVAMVSALVLARAAVPNDNTKITNGSG